jgi:hypothetical protein
MLPARLALALQADGWYLRRDIIWAKATSVDRRGHTKPESTSDRPSTSHEYVYMFSKSERYFYDKFAVSENIDSNAVAEYNLPDADQGMFQVRDGETIVGVSQGQAGEDGVVGTVQGLSLGADKSMASDSIRCEEIKGVGQTVCRDSETPREGTDAPTHAEGSGDSEKVAQNGEGSGVSEAVHSVGSEGRDTQTIRAVEEVSRNTEAIPRKSEGPGKSTSGRPQAAVEVGAGQVRPDGGAVGGNQDETGRSVCRLRRGEAADSRPHHSSVQGRGTHGVQHPGTVPVLQQQKRKPTTSAIGQLRSVWLTSPVPCDWEFCKSCGTLYQGPERSSIIRRYTGPDGEVGMSHQGECGSRTTARLNLNFHPERHKLISITCPKCGGTDRADSPPEHFVRHFAAYPAQLPRIAIKAGTSEKGVCPTCGKPWVRVTAKSAPMHDGESATAYDVNTSAGRLALLRQGARERGQEYVSRFTTDPDHYPGSVDQIHTTEGLNERFTREKSPGSPRRAMAPTTTGWKADCDCPATDPIPATVLDPFLGSGTTLLEAHRLGRHGIGIDLSPDYVAVATARLTRLSASPLFDQTERTCHV